MEKEGKGKSSKRGVKAVYFVIIAVGLGWCAAILSKSHFTAKVTLMDRVSRSSSRVSTKGSKLQQHGSVRRPAPPYKDPMDYKKPVVFFDITIDGEPAGRIKFELYTKQAPRAAENFRALCTGEKGTVPNVEGAEGAGLPLSFKGHEFYRVIDQFICQAGAGTDSVFGGMFKDDPGGVALKHVKKGLLSMANMGPDTNTSHFSILMNPAPHLNGHYTIFGEVHDLLCPVMQVEGMEIVERMNKLARPVGTKDERPLKPIIIADCGQLE